MDIFLKFYTYSYHYILYYRFSRQICLYERICASDDLFRPLTWLSIACGNKILPFRRGHYFEPINGVDGDTETRKSFIKYISNTAISQSAALLSLIIRMEFAFYIEIVLSVMRYWIAAIYCDKG